MKWTKITDPKRNITEADHGKVLKVGKKDFVRIVIPGMYEWWKDGFESMDKVGNDWVYLKEGEWYKELAKDKE